VKHRRSSSGKTLQDNKGKGGTVAKKAVVVIPTYNEYHNIRPLVDRMRALPLPVDLFFVDDGSPDGTGQLLDEICGSLRCGRVLHRTGKLGLGTAYREAYRILLKEDYSYFLQMDADLSHRPEDIGRLMQSAMEADLVIGSRYCVGGGSQNWPLARRMLSQAANSASEGLLGLSVKDSTAGFRCYRRAVLESLNAIDIRANGYAFQIEMAYYSQYMGFRILEIPIIFEDRKYAKSKMSYREISGAAATLTRLSAQRLFGPKNLRPLGLLQ
jgi:glycosyltransferase involved in cell wall biosynthesis